MPKTMRYYHYFLLTLLSLLTASAATPTTGGVLAATGTGNEARAASGVTITSNINLNAGALRATNNVNVGESGTAGLITLQDATGSLPTTATVATGGTTSLSSSASDGTTAFRLNAGTTHTSGNLAELRNNGTNKAVFDFGGNYIARNSEALNAALGEVNALSIANVSDVANGDSDQWGLWVGAVVDSNTAEGGWLSGTGDGTSAFFTAGYFGPSFNNTIGLNAASSGAEIRIGSGGVSLVSRLAPNIADGSTPYTFNTSIAHTSGNLLEAKNNSTYKFQLTYSGAGLFADYLSLSATTNRLSVSGDTLLFDGNPVGGSSSTTLNFTNTVNYYGNVNYKGATVYYTNVTYTIENSTVLFTNTTLTINGSSIVSANSTNTFTNKTFDAAATGNILTQRRSIKLQIPRFVDGSGCMATNTNYVALDNFMVPLFSGTADTNANYCYWITRVPADFDSSGADLTASLTVTLGGTDSDAASFTLGMVSVANGAAGLTATAANYNTITVTPTSAAAGDVESTNGTTLTGWKGAMTANQFWKIQLQRVNNSNDDSIAMQELEIFYDSTQ